MAKRAERDGIVWARPWLDASHDDIEAYARRHRLRFVDDPSNGDMRYARSRLRADVMPALRQGFPSAEAMLAASAARAAEATAVLAEVAQMDMATTVDGAILRLVPWRALSEARRRNVLRAWLRHRLGQGAAETLIARLMRELPGSGPAEWPCESVMLRRYRGRLEALPAAAAATAVGGALRSTPVVQGGVSLGLLRGAYWQPRRGGERFQRAAGTPPRSLKKQFQTAGVPAWQRDAPLLFSADGQLLFVPGLGIDARALAAPGEAQCALSWERQA
jgi:tRNA(Ile)-lysidine synthase